MRDFWVIHKIDLDDVLWNDPSPVLIRRVENLLKYLFLEKKTSAYIAKSSKIADRKLQPDQKLSPLAQKVADRKLQPDQKLSPLAQKVADRKALEEAERHRLEDDFEYYGWDLDRYKVKELIDVTLAVNHHGDEPVQFSKGPGDKLIDIPTVLDPDNPEHRARILALLGV